MTVEVREQDFVAARNELVPSVSFEELRQYERVRATFEGERKKDVHKDDGDAQVTEESHRPTLSDRGGSYATNGANGKAPVVANGGGSKRLLPGSSGPGAGSDADEDFVIRTDKLSLNKAAAAASLDAPRPFSAKGKGKGKSKGKGKMLKVDGGDDLYD